MRTCYDCEHSFVCAFHQGIDNMIKHNIRFIDVDEPASSPRSFIHIHKAIATACIKFKERPQ